MAPFRATSSAPNQDKIFYSGGFYGPNGEELAGFLRHDNDEVNGVFSGTKQ